MSKTVKNTLSGRSRGPRLKFLFNPKTIISLVLIGVFSFGALIALSGYAGDLRKDFSGNATANSRSAIGYAGYVQLLKDMGYDVTLPANLAAPIKSWETRPLRIYSLVNTYQSEAVKNIPEDEAKLIILPKWEFVRNREKISWVDKPIKDQTLTTSRLSKLLEEIEVDLTIEQAGEDEKTEDYTISFTNLSSNETQTDEDVEAGGIDVTEEDESVYNYDIYTINSPIDQLQFFDIPQAAETPDVILTAGERPILIRLAGTQTYLLSEPDILNTQGLNTQRRARLAVNILDVIAEYEDLTPQAANFDLSIHGLGGGRNIIKLMTLPPFLAATLCLLAAGGIVAWQAFSRFGDPLRRDPNFAQGPVSLAKSAAEFMAVSGRVQHMAPDYAQLTRQQVIRNMGLIGQDKDHIVRAIKARELHREISPSFDDLTANIRVENTNLIEHARAMTRWKEEMMS